MRSARQWGRVICREMGQDGNETRERAVDIACRIQADTFDEFIGIVDKIRAEKSSQRAMMVDGATYCCLPEVEEWDQLVAQLREQKSRLT